MALVAAFMNY